MNGNFEKDYELAHIKKGPAAIWKMKLRREGK